MPSPAQQKEAEQRIREIFRSEYSSKSPDGARRLAEMLLLKAGDSRGNLPELFVLLRESRDLAARCGAAATALKAVEEMAKAFDIDRTAMKKSVLSEAAKNARTPLDLKDIASGHLALCGEAFRAEDCEEARKLLGLAEAASRSARDPALSASVQELRGEISEVLKRFKEYQEARRLIGVNEMDPGANLKAGKFLCLCLGEWAKGLPFLARGSDSDLVNLAEKEKVAPARASDQVDVGNGWLRIAERSTGSEKLSLKLRGAGWLAQACSQSEGLDREKLLQVLEKAAQEAPFPRLCWQGVDAPPGFVAARFNGKDGRGWEPVAGGWKFSNLIASDSQGPLEAKDRFLRSALAARWVRVIFEFRGGTPGLYFNTSKETGGRIGVNLDSEARYNSELKIDISMDRWNTLIVDFKEGAARISFNDKPSTYTFSLSGPAFVLIKAQRGELRVRKLIAFGFNP